MRLIGILRLRPVARVDRRIRLLDLLLTWQTRAFERLRLARLDDRMLKDIGMTRADVMREISKPFWRE